MNNSSNYIEIPLDIPNVTIIGTEITGAGELIISIESNIKGTNCGCCGKWITKSKGKDRWIKVRHLPILRRATYLRYRAKRYECPFCVYGPTTTQILEWSVSQSPHTKAYNEYLLCMLVNSTVKDVSIKEKVGYDAVLGTLKREIEREVNWKEFDDLETLGIDEIALTKGHKNFAVIISVKQADGRLRLVSILPNRKKETVRQFLESIPVHLRATITQATTDMWEGYINALQEFKADHKDVSLKIVIDRFHIAQNYRRRFDRLRSKEIGRLKEELSEEEYAIICKGMLWILRKNHRDLNAQERQRLRKLFSYSPSLKEAYTVREELTAIFELDLTKADGLMRLRKWIAKVRQSGVSCFKKFLKTLEKYIDKVANYFTKRASSGFVEGLNNKIKTIKRRCYGLHKIASLFQRIFLDLEGYRRFA
jgi:transposase